MSTYRKKPVEVEAINWTGSNTREVDAFFGLMQPGEGRGFLHQGTSFLIATLEGAMRCEVGDWIIRGVKGEFYPCKPDIFEATYEPVEAST